MPAGTRAPSLTNATLAASRLLHRRSPTARLARKGIGRPRARPKKVGRIFGPRRGLRLPAWPRLGHNFANDPRSALTSAIRRFVSSPLRACAGALSGGLEAGLDVLAFCFRRFMLFTIR